MRNCSDDYPISIDSVVDYLTCKCNEYYCLVESYKKDLAEYDTNDRYRKYLNEAFNHYYDLFHMYDEIFRIVTDKVYGSND